MIKLTSMFKRGFFPIFFFILIINNSYALDYKNYVSGFSITVNGCQQYSENPVGGWNLLWDGNILPNGMGWQPCAEANDLNYINISLNQTFYEISNIKAIGYRYSTTTVQEYYKTPQIIYVDVSNDNINWNNVVTWNNPVSTCNTGGTGPYSGILEIYNETYTGTLINYIRFGFDGKDCSYSGTNASVMDEFEIELSGIYTLNNTLPTGSITIEKDILCYNTTKGYSEVKINYDLQDDDVIYYAYDVTNRLDQNLYYRQDFLFNYNDCVPDWSFMNENNLIGNDTTLYQTNPIDAIVGNLVGFNDLYLTASKEEDLNGACRGSLNIFDTNEPFYIRMPEIYEDVIDIWLAWKLSENIEFNISFVDSEFEEVFSYVLNYSDSDNSINYNLMDTLSGKVNSSFINTVFFIDRDKYNINFTFTGGNADENISFGSFKNIKYIKFDQTSNLYNKAKLQMIFMNGKNQFYQPSFSTTRLDNFPINITDGYQYFNVYISDSANQPDNYDNYSFKVYVDGSNSCEIFNDYKDNFLSKTYGSFYGSLINDLELNSEFELIFWIAYVISFFILFFIIKNATLTFQLNNIIYFIFAFLGFSTLGQFIGISVLLMFSLVPIFAEVLQTR